MKWWPWLLVALGVLVAGLVAAWAWIGAKDDSGVVTWAEGLGKAGETIDDFSSFWGWMTGLFKGEEEEEK
jgi:hypothetical protein